MLKLGIDEAGRGPVVGPLVMAGCLIDSKTEAEFKKLGVKDSKKLTRKKREELELKIKELADTFEIIIIPPIEIDMKNDNGTNLNNLEAITVAEIVNRINKGFSEISVVADCPSPNIKAWTGVVKAKIVDTSNIKLSCEHKADVNHMAAAAASILAKCVRDREMDFLNKKYGELGSGYCHDPVTMRFIEKNVKKYNSDGIFRKTWITWKNAMARKSQKSLGDF
jgi:ribonuclease HII